jgi:hypothetical protein
MWFVDIIICLSTLAPNDFFFHFSLSSFDFSAQIPFRSSQHDPTALLHTQPVAVVRISLVSLVVDTDNTALTTTTI